MTFPPLDRLIAKSELVGDPKRGIPPMVPYSDAHLLRLEKQEPPAFPLRIQLGGGRVAWKLSEVLAWIDSRPRGSPPQRCSRWANRNGAPQK